MSSKKIDLTLAYTKAQNDEMECDSMDLRIQDFKNRIVQGESKHSDLCDRQSAAKQVKEACERVLAGPPVFGRGAAQSDLERAEKVLKYCAEWLPKIEEHLAGLKADLATWEERRKNFDMSGLRAKRELQELLLRCRLPGH